MSRRLFLTILLPALCAAGLIFACFSLFRTRDIAGLVRDAETGRPIYPATLFFESEGVDSGMVQTAPAGGYALRAPRRTFSVRVLAPGYYPAEGICPAWTFSRAPMRCDFVLQPKHLRVRLLDAWEPARPVAEAEITANGIALCPLGEGEYIGSGLEIPAAIAVHAPGYKPWEGVLVEPRYIDTEETFAISLEPTLLEGVVFAADTGEPIAGARLQAGDILVRSDSAGAFRLTHVREREQLRASAEGFHPYLGPLISDIFSQENSPVHIELEPVWTRGWVRDEETGKPLAGARLSAGAQSVTSGEEGEFLLRALPSGTPILAEASDYFSRTVVFAGEEELDLRLRQIRVEVQVADALTGQPIAGALLRDVKRTYRADERGSVTLIGTLPGTRIRAEAENHAPAEIPYAGEESLHIPLRALDIAVYTLDRESGLPLPNARWHGGDEILRTDAAGIVRLSAAHPEREWSVLAAGHRRHRLTLKPQETCADASACVQLHPTSTGTQPALAVLLPPFRARAVYIPFGLLSRPDKVESILELVRQTELNAVVIDMKGDRGFLGYPSQVPLAQELGVLRQGVLDIRALLQECQEAGIYTIARIVVFKDHPLATQKPEWAVVTAEGEVWLDREGLGWANPYLQEVRDYNISLAQEVAELGFDEIQFDYLRFPSDGDVGRIVYTQTNTLETRSEAIRLFVEQARGALEPLDVYLSGDVFGLTIWVPPANDMGIGQRVQDIAPYLDYLCPMIYPSTFGPGNLGYDEPANYPYEVIHRSVIQAWSRLPAHVKVRPWLQAYWYTVEEQMLQRQAAEDAGAWGWSFWNAGGTYDPTLFAPP